MIKLLGFALISGIMAATGGESLPSLPAPAQYGILGIGLAIVASGRVLVPIGWLKDEREARMRETARADAERARTDAMQLAAQEKWVPAMVASTTALDRSSQVITQLLQEKRGL